MITQHTNYVFNIIQILKVIDEVLEDHKKGCPKKTGCLTCGLKNTALWDQRNRGSQLRAMFGNKKGIELLFHKGWKTGIN